MIQNAILVGLLHGLGDLGHVGVALADVHVVADADDVGHEGDHGSGLADGLAVSDLGLLLVQVLQLKAEQVGCLREGEARTGGVVTEQGDGQTRIEDLGRNVVLAQLAQGVGDDVERLSSSVVLSQVCRKSLPYMPLKSRPFSCSTSSVNLASM